MRFVHEEPVLWSRLRLGTTVKEPIGSAEAAAGVRGYRFRIRASWQLGRQFTLLGTLRTPLEALLNGPIGQSPVPVAWDQAGRVGLVVKTSSPERQPAESQPRSQRNKAQA